MVQQVIFKWLLILAKRMITEWGMSEKLGRLRYNNDSEEVFSRSFCMLKQKIILTLQLK